MAGCKWFISDLEAGWGGDVQTWRIKILTVPTLVAGVSVGMPISVVGFPVDREWLLGRWGVF